MRISELITLLTNEKERLGDRELLEGVTFGSHRPLLAASVLDGNHLAYPEKAVLFLQTFEPTPK